MKSQRQNTEPSITDQAAKWVSELEDSAAPSKTRAACIAWLKESPLHVKEFLYVSAMWSGFDGMDAQRRVDVGQLLAESSAKVVSLSAETDVRHPGFRRHNGKWPWVFGAAAAIALIAVTAAWLTATRTPSYSTAVGEQRAIKLSDGSLVNLNTRSRIEIHLSQHARGITLLEGEALFTVARDSARPFRVQSGDTVIEALGTQFNVYRRSRDTTVSVIEGAVQVSGNAQAPAKLTAGEQANVAPQGGIVKRSAPDVGKAIAWRERRLVFRGDSLEEVATQLNRYNDSMHIRVDGSARERRLIGVFAADDPDSLLQFLARDDSLLVERNSAAITIRARAAH